MVKLKEEIFCEDCTTSLSESGTRVPGCSECRNTRRRIWAARARAEKGLLPWGEATAVYRKRQQEEYKLKRQEARKALGKPAYGSGLRDPRCSVCGAIKERKDGGYCDSCKRENARNRRQYLKESNPDFYVQERLKRGEKYRTDAEFRFKESVRRLTWHAIKAGKLVSQACEVCGKKKVDAHHEDYMKPFDVRWLCRKHHLARHAELNQLNKET